MSSTLAAPVPTCSSVRLFGRRRAPKIPLALADVRPDLSAIRGIPDWQFVERSAFGFVDQVAVAPAAVVAFTVRHHIALVGDAHVRRAWKAIRDAKGSAALMKQLLGSDAPDVVPVLVIFGPGAPELVGGHLLVKGVHVVDGLRPELWSHRFATPVLAELERHRLARSLRR